MAKKKSGIPPNFHSTFFVPQKKCPLTISDFSHKDITFFADFHPLHPGEIEATDPGFHQ